MKRTFSVVLVATSAFSLASCKRPAMEVGTTAYIIGPTNDIRPAKGEGETEVPPAAVNGAVMVATALKDKRVKFCSGTLVAPATGQTNLRVLTNHHCFAETGADGKATRNLLVEACSFTTVYFGYLPGQAQTATSTGCQAGTLRTSFDGDLGVFTLAQNPPDKFQPVALWDGDDAAVDRTALIVHYPDVEAQLETPPQGGARLPTAAVTVSNCKVVGLFDVAEWDLDRTLPYSLRHSCDLIHGSSGSGLIDAATGALLGVNWGGIKVTYAEGVRTDNVATRASFAKAFLESREGEVVRTAEQQRTTHAVALGAPRKEGDAEAEKSDNLGKSLKKKTCSTVEFDASPGGGGASVSLLVLLLGPLALLAMVRKGH